MGFQVSKIGASDLNTSLHSTFSSMQMMGMDGTIWLLSAGARTCGPCLTGRW
jgi:hypothetical protein